MEVIMAMESEIQNAIRSRLSHFKQHSDSLTFEGVRRLLEKDLVLQQFSLDPHKTFINNYLVKCLEEAGYDYDVPKSSAKVRGKVASIQETEEPNRECQSKDVEDICPAGGKKAKNLQRRVKFATGEKEAKDYGGKVVQREARIKKAVTKRIITMAVLCRLLEEDLQLDKFTLDPYRKFINQQVDEVLESSEVVEPSNNGKKSSVKKPDPKVTKKASCEENLDASNKESGNRDEVKPRKEGGSKAKLQASVGAKKLKRKDTDQSSRKKIKSVKSASRDDNGREDNGDNSKDQPHSSPEGTLLYFLCFLFATCVFYIRSSSSRSHVLLLFLILCYTVLIRSSRCYCSCCSSSSEKMAARNQPGRNQTKDLKCATHLLSDKFRNMSEQKKTIVRDLGFGGLMHIPPLRVHHQVLRELANNFKLGENRLKTGYGSFKITPRKIGHALGINATGGLFPQKVNYKKLSEDDKVIFRRFQGKTLKSLTDEMMDIGVGNEEDRLMFKRIFILYIQMAFLLPTTINKISPVHLAPIFEMDSITERNWGGHVLTFIIKGITDYKEKKKKAIDGCLFALMIIYFHLSKNKGKKRAERPRKPWIANWSKEQLVERMNAETEKILVSEHNMLGVFYLSECC
ncbi:hypothetical protein Ahy_A07g033684 [Arachis hypogaea]|uniref:DEK-C domain-containing protein n=1 Tax=Arachis hypogaea TaxID=3818 RepID=A0A445C9V5_ARAHY|nr:hypothetical protein Ahy_A07g033684 [Arachis hypogaea]